MINKLMILIALSFLLYCKDKALDRKEIQSKEIQIQDAGRLIQFQSDSLKLQLFTTKKITIIDLKVDLKAPATVIGRVKRSQVTGSNIILFSSSELTGVYANYVQNISQIQIAQTNFNRTKDLYEHNAVTGREMNDASSDLLSKKAVLAETEARLIQEGFDPSKIQSAKSGTVWLISDLPESELNIALEGLECILEFPSFPSEVFAAKIEAIADVLNTGTRKARIRILLNDSKEKLKPGMYGKMKLVVNDSGLMVPKKALVTFNSKYFLFVKVSSNTFERREVTLSTETEEFIEIASGLNEGEEVVIENVYLLKGLSIGI
ncbi:MAG: efflux RND transporter periplasmic adaptor subunit [Leptospiraceae bacterium]|nr:efflux RND transporter periplasmic adaptor subunit [Leptospiraceae bacterium]